MSLFNCRRLSNRCTFPLGYLCTMIGLAYLLKGIVVMMLYLCSRARFRGMSTLRLIGAGKFLLKAGLSSHGVS